MGRGTFSLSGLSPPVGIAALQSTNSVLHLNLLRTGACVDTQYVTVYTQILETPKTE